MAPIERTVPLRVVTVIPPAQSWTLAELCVPEKTLKCKNGMKAKTSQGSADLGELNMMDFT